MEVLADQTLFPAEIEAEIEFVPTLEPAPGVLEPILVARNSGEGKPREAEIVGDAHREHTVIWIGQRRKPNAIVAMARKLGSGAGGKDTAITESGVGQQRWAGCESVRRDRALAGPEAAVVGSE